MVKQHSKQGAVEILTEITMLTELRHVNLVSLIGYCTKWGKMIIVYNYMAYNQLYKLERIVRDGLSVTWKQRLNICIGAARGLHYLHAGQSFTHCDAKASNINSVHIFLCFNSYPFAVNFSI